MRFVFPKGKKKALTFSYDDNQIYDRQLVEIFNRYGMRGTFHINSGNLDVADRGIDHFIMKEEVATLYRNHEVACHGVEHKNLPGLNKQQMVMELAEDRKTLEQLSGGFVQGLSYAFGSYTQEVIEIVKAVGIKYSRTVNGTNQFFPPVDFLQWHPTCHHNGPIMELGKQFLEVPHYIELPVMYVWGHSYEFDRDGSWDKIEEFAKLMSGKEDIWYATNIEICEYIQAIRGLEYTMDGSHVKNPSNITVYYEENGEIKTIEPGELV